MTPDLVVISERHSKLLPQLSQVAPTYLSIDSGRDIDQGTQQFIDFATLIGDAERAKKALAVMDQELADARLRLPGLDGATLSSAYIAADQIWTAPIRQWFSKLGWIPSPSQPTTDNAQDSYSYEYLDRLDGEILILGNDPDGRKKVEADPRFENLPAVKNGTVMWTDQGFNQAIWGFSPYAQRLLLPKLIAQFENAPLNKERR